VSSFAAPSDAHAISRSERRRSFAVPPIVAALLALLFFAANVLAAGGASRDYDEGVYWQSLRSLLEGHALFREVFAPQGPVFFYGLMPIFIGLGQSISAARIAIAVFALVAAVAVFVAAWAVAGRWAGLIAVGLLMSDPIWSGEARTLHAEVPSLTLALVALALGMIAARPAVPVRRASWLALASGAALALGTATKAFVVLFAVGMVVQLLVSRRGDAWRLVAIGAAAFLVTGVLVFLPYASDWRTVYQDLVTVHLNAGRALNPGIASNLALLHLGRELPLEAAAIVIAGLGIIRRDLALVPVIVWLVATVAALLTYHPLFAHEVALVVVPLVFLCAVGTARLAAALTLQHWLPAAAGVMVLGVIALGGTRDLQAWRTAARPSAYEQRLAQQVAAHTEPGQLVIGDNQYVIALANRDTPAPLVDTSYARVLSQALTAAGIEQVAVDQHVRAFLFDTGRLNAVTGLRSWVASTYPGVITIPGGGTLYFRP
jgi:4-amino-4-deoxy-L-arabinose transferase-like glycosyltransferase